MDIRFFAPEDAAAFQSLRLQALLDTPEAFSSSYEDEHSKSIEQITQQLQDGPPNAFVFGAWLDDDPVAMLGLFRYRQIKMRHKATFGMMYVAPYVRSQGVGSQLLQHVIDYAKSLDGLEALTLGVTVGNDAARKLYVHSGFTPYGVEPRYIHIDDRYYDIEWMYLSIG